jgi:hypothetical protein
MRNRRKVRWLIAWVAALSLVVVSLIAFQPAFSANSQQVELSEDHATPEDYVWDRADVTNIALNGATINVDGDGATVDGSTVTIDSAGNYRFSGSLTDGQLIVDTQDEAIVRLILNGVRISSSTSAPIYIADAEETLIVLEEGSENVVSDGASYVFASTEEDEPNASIFSKSDLTFYGGGTLTVTGNYNDGIASKDGLVIASGTINVSAVDDGIRGKDYLVVEDGTITVNAGGDGLKSDNAEDAALGYVSVATGSIHVTAGSDAITAQTSVLISGGEFSLVSGGSNIIDASLSAKGIKAGVNLQIDGGNFTIDSVDDAMHSNTNITVNGGTFALTTGDDGVHADAALTINGGDINIVDSYEGIESAVITLNGGSVHLVSSDDGVNVSSADGNMMGGGRGGQAAVTSTNNYLYINGGYLVVDADGDGVDVNGAIEMNAGTLIVNGPTEQMNGALDYDAWFTMTGGWFIAAGSSGMAQSPDTSSTQSSLLLNFTSVQAAGSLVHIQGSDGSDLLTFAPTKAYQSITFSSPELAQGATYDVYVGGSSSAGASDGVYDGGSYSAGEQYTSFTVSGIVTSIGSAGFPRR